MEIRLKFWKQRRKKSFSFQGAEEVVDSNGLSHRGKCSVAFSKVVGKRGRTEAFIVDSG